MLEKSEVPNRVLRTVRGVYRDVHFEGGDYCPPLGTIFISSMSLQKL